MSYMVYTGFVDTQYEVGDIVRVRPDIRKIERDPDHIGCIVESMTAMAGREFEVSEFFFRKMARLVRHDGINGNPCYWLDDWLEPVYHDSPDIVDLFNDLLEV